MENGNMLFQLPTLPFAYDAFEPYIDAQTMEIHHTKHHQTYIDQLNNVIRNNPDLEQLSLEALLRSYQSYDQKTGLIIKNHGGGHFNHTFFWTQMHPEGLREPIGTLAEKIIATFGSFQNFKTEFESAAKSVFGSGWAWLCIDLEKQLVIIATPNQDAPLLYNIQPVMGLDVWEHAYYLKYQNRRVDYINAWWHVVDWQVLEKNYQKAIELVKPRNTEIEGVVI